MDNGTARHPGSFTLQASRRGTRSFHFVKKKRPILTFELHISEHMMSYDWTGERTRRMKMMRYAIAIALALGLIAGAASWTLQTI